MASGGCRISSCGTCSASSRPIATPRAGPASETRSPGSDGVLSPDDVVADEGRPVKLSCYMVVNCARRQCDCTYSREVIRECDRPKLQVPSGNPRLHSGATIVQDYRT